MSLYRLFAYHCHTLFSFSSLPSYSLYLYWQNVSICLRTAVSSGVDINICNEQMCILCILKGIFKKDIAKYYFNTHN